MHEYSLNPNKGPTLMITDYKGSPIKTDKGRTYMLVSEESHNRVGFRFTSMPKYLVIFDKRVIPQLIDILGAMNEK